MKKTIRVLSVVFILLIVFSATAFAEPAKPVSYVEITDVSIGSNGNLYITVKVTGYGQPSAILDGAVLTDYSIQTIGRPTVTGFIYTYDCGQAELGYHNFAFSIRSFNYPFNTLNVSCSFTIS